MTTDTMKKVSEVLDTRRSLTFLIVTIVLYVALVLFLVYDPVILNLPDPSVMTLPDPTKSLPSLGSWWDEDSIVEYLTSAFAAVAGILWLWAISRARSRGLLLRPRDYVLSLLLAFMMIVLAGEEISWGQRIVGFETPEAYKEINWQDEVTLHNLNVRTAKVLYFTTLVWGVVLPLLRFFSRFVRRLAWTTRCPIPPFFLASLFLSAPVFRLTMFDTYGNFAREGMELIFAMAFMAAALHATLRPEEIYLRPADEAR